MKKIYLYVLFLIVFTFLLYGNTIKNDYCFDDDFVTNNSKIEKGIKGIPGIFQSRYRESSGYAYGYRPVALTTFAVEYSFFGFNPHISHLINVLLYACAGVFLFIFLTTFLKNYRVLFSFVITVLFLVHPVHTEVVASLKNREVILCFLGCIISLYFFIQYSENKKWKYIIFGIISYVLACLSKENAYTFIGIIPLALYFAAASVPSNTIHSPTAPASNEIRLIAILKNRLIIIGLLMYILGFLTRIWIIYFSIILFYVHAYKIIPAAKNNLLNLFRNKYILTGTLLFILMAFTSLLKFFKIVNLFYYFNKEYIAAGILLIPFILYTVENAFKSFQYKRIPAIWKTIILLSVLTGAVSYLSYNLPEKYLPAEQNKLFSFENPLINEGSNFIKYPTGFYTLLYYLKLLLFPHPLRFYYGYNMLPAADWVNGPVIISFLIHVAVCIYSVVRLREKHILSFAILFYLITISIFTNMFIPITGIIGERHLFFPSVGFAIIIAYFIFKISSVSRLAEAPASGGKLYSKAVNIPSKKILRISGILLLILIPCSVKTINRNADWKNPLTLYAHDIIYLENSVKANSLYASELIRQMKRSHNIAPPGEKIGLAIKHFNQALLLDSTHEISLMNLGAIYFDYYKRYDLALVYFQKAVRVNPLHAQGYYNLALTYENLGNFDEAVEQYKKTLEYDVNHIGALSNVANLFSKTGDFNLAVEMNERIMKIDTTLDLPYINIGRYYLMKHDTTNGIKYLERGIIKQHPENNNLRMFLFSYFKQKGDTAKAKHYH